MRTAILIGMGAIASLSTSFVPSAARSIYILPLAQRASECDLILVGRLHKTAVRSPGAGFVRIDIDQVVAASGGTGVQRGSKIQLATKSPRAWVNEWADLPLIWFLVRKHGQFETKFGHSPERLPETIEQTDDLLEKLGSPQGKSTNVRALFDYLTIRRKHVPVGPHHSMLPIRPVAR